MSTAISEHWLLCQLCRVLAVLACLVSCLAGEARADDEATKAEAGERFAHGVTLVGEGDYPLALGEFQKAYELTHDWRLLFNIAQVMQRLGDYPGALAELERYLAEGGERVAAARRESVETEILRLHERVAYLSIRVDQPGAEVRVDDQLRGVSPLAERLMVAVGRRKVTVHKPGFADAERYAEVGGGSGEALTFELVPLAHAKGESRRTLRKRQVPWLAWTATGVLAAGSAVTGALALVAKGDAERKSEHLTTKAELDDARQHALALGIASDVLAASAVGVGIFALYRTLHRGEVEEPARVSTEVGLSHIRVRVRF